MSPLLRTLVLAAVSAAVPVSLAAAQDSPLVGSCMADVMASGKAEADARTSCTCAVGYIKERLSEKEFTAFELAVPMMAKSPEGPTPDMIEEIQAKAGMTPEEFDLLGQKVSSIGAEADKSCGTN